LNDLFKTLNSGASVLELLWYFIGLRPTREPWKSHVSEKVQEGVQDDFKTERVDQKWRQKQYLSPILDRDNGVAKRTFFDRR